MPSKLFEQEAFYRTAFSAFVETAVDAVILIDAKSNIQLFNPAAEKMFGYSQTEILGQTIKTLMPDPYRREHDQYVESYKTTGTKKIIGIGREVLGQRKDGTIFPVDLAISEMEVAGKKYFNGVIRDISHLKQTENEVVEKNILLDTIFKMQTKFIASEKTNIVFDELLAEILHVSESEYGFIGEIKQPEAGAPYLKTRAITNIAWDKATQKLYEQNAPEGLEFRDLDTLFGHTIKTGEMIITNDPSNHPKSKGIPKNHPALNAYLGMPLFSGDEFIGMVGIANRKQGYDEVFAKKMQTLFVTCSSLIEACKAEQGRHSAETLLVKSEERLRSSQKYAEIGTWDWNIETGDLHWSDRIAPLFGFPAGDLETTYDNFLNAVHPDDRDLVVEAVRACVEDGADYDIEHRCIWPDKTVHWLSEKGDVQRDESDKAIRMLGVVQDITLTKIAEKNLILAKEEAEQANKAKSEFLSRMSHELRTPMNAILGFSQLLGLEKDLSENQRQGVTEIGKAGHHLLELINDVLDLAKIESGKLVVSHEPINASEVLAESLELVSQIAIKHKVDINYAPNESEKCIINADKTRLKQIILNLVSNAIKYNKVGGRVLVECYRLDNGYLRIKISDTGLGIESKFQSDLFSSFNRLGAEATSTEGTGIGLVITKSLVELMSGTIDFESTVGEGSSFWVDLPLAVNDVEGASDAYSKDELQKLDELNHKEYTIVYIEDNLPNLRLMKSFFTRHPDIKLYTETSGKPGIILCEKVIPDLILLDINIPEMNGYEIAKKIKSIRNLENRPIVAVSADAMEKDIKKALANGFDAYIVKPVELSVLLDVVQKLLPKSKITK